MSFELEGAADLLNDLGAMAAALDTNGDGVADRRALQAGAKPIHQKMLANASSDPKIITGALHDSIHIGPIKGGVGKGKRITIGVHHSEMGAFYANPLEFGHGGPAPAPAHPFVRPAFDAEVDTAYETIKAQLRDALSRRG